MAELIPRPFPLPLGFLDALGARPRAHKAELMAQAQT